MRITLKKGLDLPISGQPQPQIDQGPVIQQVALLGEEISGLKPLLQVTEGERVKKGQLLFLDKNRPGVRYTSPAGGIITALHRGARRVLQSLVIQVEDDETLTFAHYPAEQLKILDAQFIRDMLITSGLWTALRSRPFGHVPAIDNQPTAIFVTAIDTQPLAADPALIIQEQPEAFVHGMTLLTRLTSGPLYLCQAAGASIPQPVNAQIVTAEFSGPHPAGLVGTHIHTLHPVNLKRSVWHIGYQDVIAIGHLFTHGEIYTDRVIALGGPQVMQPRLLRTRLGANLIELTAQQLKPGDNRIISGSVLHGTEAIGPQAFLGRYHQQVSVLLEGRQGEFFGWVRPGGSKFSITRTTYSHFSSPNSVNITTSRQGDARAMVPIGTYERVMPLDLLPTLLLRAVIIGDSEQAQALGCLELEEEDLALCTFVCPGKYAYGPLLRQLLTTIEKEG
jgi:Na+-transporting NADH:ubiquinone oxidoreductase subunit A